MEKFLAFFRESRYTITLTAVTIALICGFVLAWNGIPATWWYQTLLIFSTLLMETGTLFLVCEHISSWQKRYPKHYDGELIGVLWCHLLGFIILAVITACFAWENTWMFIGTIVWAFILLGVDVLIVMLTHNQMFGNEGSCKEW